MSPDRATIAVRERGLAELYDLALLVVRRRPWPPLLLALLGAAPFAALDVWLLAGGAADADGLGRWYPLLLLIAVQAPFAFAPLTAWLGAAMFDAQPRFAQALRDGWRPWFGLLLGGLTRGLLAAFPLLLALWPPHFVETLVLERGRLRAAWSRAAALRGVAGGDGVVHLLVATLVLAATVWCLAGTVLAAKGLLLHADPWTWEDWHIWLPGRSLVPHLAVWAAAGWLTVVRFLWYIDLRTRHEGWEVDLSLRQAALRLREGGR